MMFGNVIVVIPALKFIEMAMLFAGSAKQSRHFPMIVLPAQDITQSSASRARGRTNETLSFGAGALQRWVISLTFN